MKNIMNQQRYLVGIDLGTTNTVVAYAAPGADTISVLGIEQLVASGEVKALPLLPSLRYHPAPGELAAGELQLPWSSQPAQPATQPAAQTAVLGSLARRLGAQVPGRLVASAKSWLSHAAVDRLADILPWGAAPDVPKVSPVAASASYLAHVRAAWNHRFPDYPLERQQVVLTVPASFDEGARALTLRAAAEAGLPTLRLLEEPQAAFYDWLFRHRASLGQELEQSRNILVADVGGGTTDLTLIRVEVKDGEPVLTRTAVGKHLMLGGDNMDLVLARVAESRLLSEGEARLSAGRMSQLIERCRAAKEQLLAAGAPEQALVTLLGAGTRLVGAARSVPLLRAEVEHAIVDGFFPRVGLDQAPRPRRAGLVEFGLPYASDPAITRHLAAFLTRHGESGELPDTLLLNGGVFRADALATRLQEVLADWRGAPLRLLHNDNPDVAVARGAVAYALAGAGLAPRIGGGSARSYFLMLEAEDGESGTRRAVCVLPRGSEAGREILLRDRLFALRLGQPVRFHLVSTSADSGRPVPQPGQLITLDQGEFEPLPPIASVMPASQPGARQEVQVELASALTEVGTLEMHCVASDDRSRRWLLEFQLRGGAPPASEDAPLPPRYPEALDRIERIFGSRAQRVEAKEVRQLRQQLEKLLGSRERWDTPLLRHLFDALWQRSRGRRRSADHERLWLNLAGYCLRPGFGYPLDDWRCEQLWSIFEAGVQHRQDSQTCAEWWTLWRRTAGGLEREAQLRLLEDFAFNLQADAAERKRRPATLVAGGEDDMLRLAASLERIPPEYKVEIGDWMFGRMKRPDGSLAPDERMLWAIGRIGARSPFYGSAHDVVAPDTALQWLELLFSLDWRRIDAAGFAAAHLARMTGDRTRDLTPDARKRVIERLSSAGAAPAWIAMVREVVQLDEASEKRVLGESLPPGLKLVR
jgi:molecular chaperone DnaK (HSP70)